MPIALHAHYLQGAASREQSLSEKHAQEMATCQADHQRAREEAAAKADEEASHLWRLSATVLVQSSPTLDWTGAEGWSR